MTSAGTSRGGADEEDPKRVFQSCLVPASLAVVATAMQTASSALRHIYVEYSEAGWRWSPATQGGPDPLMRTVAAFLEVDYTKLLLGFEPVGEGYVAVSPRDPVVDARGAVLDVEEGVTLDEVIRLVVLELNDVVMASLGRAAMAEGSKDGEMVASWRIDEDTSANEASAYIRAIESGDKAARKSVRGIEMAEWEGAPDMLNVVDWAMEAAGLPSEILDALEGDWFEAFAWRYGDAWAAALEEGVLRRAKEVLTRGS